MELALNKLPWKVQVGVFLAVAVAALGGFYWYYVQGAQDTIATQQKKLDGMLAEAAKANATARQLKGFQSQVAELTAERNALRVERALEILADEVPDHLKLAGDLRVKHKQASLEELGQLHEPPLTKDAIAGRIRRLLAMADKRAEDLGIPDTEASLTPEMLAEE